MILLYLTFFIVGCTVYESCANLKNAGIQESGTYTIDPDGVGQGESHFPVQCDMTSDITTGKYIHIIVCGTCSHSLI